MSRLSPWLETLYQDARHALRTYKSSPGFVAAAALALTLGIGANTAVFSVVNSILLRPVPFADSDRLLMLMITANGNPFYPASSPAQFMHFKSNTTTIEDIAAFTSTSLNFSSADASARIHASQVSEAYFRAFRAPLIQGRSFTEEEDLPGGGHVAVISHAFWTRYLSADPNIVGKPISLSGDTYTVVGVVGPEFDVRELGSPELWTPLQADPGTTDQAYLYKVAARLKPGVTLEQAQAELAASAAAYRERFPGVLGPRAGFGALTLQESLVGSDARSTLLVLVGAVAFVLLIACANVANLLLVRACGRRGEIGVRSALGASRSRIVQALLIEGLILSIPGGALGLIAGFFGIRALLAIDTAGLPRLGESGVLIGLDWRVIAFTVAVSITTGLVFSLAPALVSLRSSLVEAISDSPGRTGGGIRQHKASSALVVAEVALAVMLLVGAALLVRTSLALNRVDPGFNAESLVTMQTSLSGPRFATAQSVAEAVRRARERVRSLPGVAESVATCCIPMQPGLGLPFNVIGRDDQGLFTGSNAVVFTSAGYFDVFGIPVLRGRSFDEADDASAPPVAIINEALARRYWPDGADPLRDRMLIGGGASNLNALAEEPSRQIIGIVGNVRGQGLASDPDPIMYVPLAQIPDALNELVVSATPMSWVVRTRDDSVGQMEAISEELRRTTGVPVSNSRTMDEVMALSVSRQRLHMLLMSVFSGSALLLATIGIYAVMAYIVQDRKREIRIRFALGATPSHVRRLIIRDGMRLVGLGMAIGLATAYVSASLLSSVLFGVEPHDTLVFVAVPAAIATVCLGAVVLPAVKASRLVSTFATTR